MKEVTFITFDGTTKVCSIPDDVKLEYKCIIATIREELSVQDDYRIKVFREGCEDALNPSSDFQSGDKYFVLYEQLSHEKTEELIYFITSRYELVRKIPFIHKMTTDIFRTTIYNRIEKLINEGAHIESLYTNDDNIRWLISYIIRFEDIELLKLLFNNGLDINSQLMTEYTTNNSSQTCDLFEDLFILYKIDLSCHYDIKHTYSMTNLGYNHKLLAHGISKNMFSLNTLIPPNNTALFYYVHKLDEFLDKYKYSIDYNLTLHDGSTFMSYSTLLDDSKRFEERLNNHPQLDINFQYTLKYDVTTKHKYTRPGDTLLHMLCRNDELNLVKIQLLLDRGTKLIKNDEGETQIDVLNKQPDTPLRYNILQILENYFGRM